MCNSRSREKHQRFQLNDNSASRSVERLQAESVEEVIGPFSGREVLQRLRANEHVTDAEFDLFFPVSVRGLSQIHWTPVNAAVRAAQLAVRKPGDQVLDVGSGVGKFCLVGALATEGKFTGVEQRGYLVDHARDIVSRYRIARVQFIHKNMLDLDWAAFDAIYLFNPYSENLDETIRIDTHVELTSDLYIKYIRGTQMKLAALKVGTRVVTFNSFGGDFPPSYRLVHKEEISFLPLEVWEKGEAWSNGALD